MKFCMVTTFYPPYHFGGDALYVYQLSQHLVQMGHHVEVIHCRDAFNVLATEPNPSVADHPDIIVHSLQSRAGALSPHPDPADRANGLEAESH